VREREMERERDGERESEGGRAIENVQCRKKSGDEFISTLEIAIDHTC